MKCPTCGTLLGNIVLHYEEELNDINNNDKLTDKQKKKSRSKLVDKLVDKYCCKMRLITYVDSINVII